MKYDFDTLISRRNTGSYKWDVAKENELPMWVADMDFPVAPKITEALFKRVAHHIYGYQSESLPWKQSYIKFWERRYGFSFTEDEMAFATGVVPTLSSAVRKLAKPNGKVLIMTPVYNIFFNSIVNNGRTPSCSELLYDGETYSIDFKDLEKRMEDPECSLMILCNPQNPVGRLYSKEELAKIGELAKKHGVIVLSDEIHGPISEPGTRYIPFASVNETNRMNSITAIAPTKAFNLAGIQTSAVVIPNEEIRKAFLRQLNTDECAEPNVFSLPAAMAAFEESEDWLEELNEVIARNRKITEAFVKDNIPDIKVIHGQATYLLWLDVSKLGEGEAFASFLREETGLIVNPGPEYGKGGEHFIRLNVACPLSRLQDGLNRLKNGAIAYKKKQNA